MNALIFKSLFKAPSQYSRFLFVTALLLLFYTCTRNYDTKNHFDYLVFSQRWLPTAYIECNEHHFGPNNRHPCSIPNNSVLWAIHGLWPTQFNHIGPFFCNKSWVFDINKLTAIEPELNLFWPNIKEGNVASLWQHEWEKHGTCASQLKSLDSEIKYFVTALKLFKTFSIQKTLTNNGILPNLDKGKNVTDLIFAIKNAFGKLPYIHCINQIKTNQPYLSEIRLCFNKDLRLMDCGNKKEEMNGNLNVRNVQTNCPLDIKIIYPPMLSPSLGKFILEDYSKIDYYDSLESILSIIRFFQWASI